MTKNRKAVLAGLVAGALVVGLGAAGAVAANKVLSPQQESQAVIDDAAAQLGVQPSALAKALKQALKNRLDAAVEAGVLTKEQAAELQARIDSSDFPLFGHPGLRRLGLGHPGPVGHGEVFAAAASYLGLSVAELRAQLAGSTMADIAKEKGKSVSGLVQAMVAAAEQELDKAVDDGRLTKEQASAIKSHLADDFERLVNAGWRHERPGHERRFGYGFGLPRGPPLFGGPHV